jgi:hypothetical protein
MTNIQRLDELVVQFVNMHDNPHDLLDLQREIIGVKYSLATEAGAARKRLAQAETDRKSLMAGAKISLKGTKTPDGKYTSMAEAEARVELDPQVIRARGEEQMADCEHEVIRLKMGAASEVITAISMRVSLLKAELRDTKTTQQT